VLTLALGVQPLRGRWFTEQEHGIGADGADPVFLSYTFCQEKFGGGESVLGRELSTEEPNSRDGVPWTVVGIMPREFRFLDMTPQPEVIAAVRLDPAAASLSSFNFHALARLAPGVTAAEARDDIERMLPIWLDEWCRPSSVRLSTRAAGLS
jgi:macrolide transport system ATP-binding/permease protein